MSKIFISIAAYRDPELLPTIKNCIENAENPNDLVFCIAWQHTSEDKWDNLDEYKSDERFRIIDIPHYKSEGVCWARAKIQEYYDGEEYYLQLDSHHRFIKDWDKRLKDKLNWLRCTGVSYKPIISTYLPSYFPEKDPVDRLNEVWALNIDRFLPEGAVFLRPHGLNGWEEMKEPAKARFMSAHFIFTLGKWIAEVPYDPYFYFHGEETSLAVKSFTWGWDIFCPNEVLVWHEYTREGKKKQWDDDSIWAQRDKASYARFRELFGMNEGEDYRNYKEAFGKYWFGNSRSLEDYERYAGLKFKTRQIHRETIDYQLPPIKGDYESGLCSKVKVCIDVWKESLKEPDYDWWAISLIDENGNDLYRRDCDKNEIHSLMNENASDQFIHIWREYEDTKLPHSWRVWPHSESKGFCDKIENKIKYE